MRRASILTGLATLLLCTLVMAQDEPVSGERAVLRKLEALRQEMAELRDQVAELRKRVAELDARLIEARGVPSLNPVDRAVATVALRKIGLPDNPTKEQVYEYVSKIAEASSGQFVFSDSDPQVAMLRKVGSENIDVLLDFDAVGYDALPFASGKRYAVEAICQLARYDTPQNLDQAL